MEFLQNLSRRQAVSIVIITSLIVLAVVSLIWYLNIRQQEKQEREEFEMNERIIQEKKEELERLRGQSNNFGPTEDPVEQKEQLDTLRRQNQLEDELGEGEPQPGETSDPQTQKDEIQKLKEEFYQ